VVLGTGGVGKSCLTIRYIQDMFIDSYDPTIEDSYRHQIEINNKSYVLEIIDTAGTEQFLSMRDMYMKTGEGFLLVYSIVDKTTFVETEELYGDILRVRDQDKLTLPLVLIGNKCDLTTLREVSPQEGQQKAAKWAVPFYETSALTNTNISEAFECLAREILKVGNRLPTAAKKKKVKRLGGCTLL